jgi:serine/threonine protein kinase
MNMEHIPTAGTVLDGQYRLLQGPTRQDLGLIYQAQDMQRDQPVEVLLLSQTWGRGVSALQQVEKGQRLVASLANSGLVPFERFGLLEGQLYLIREHSEGRTLADLLAQSGRLAVHDAVELTIRLCDILNVAHQAGLAHGSLSPHAIHLRETDDTRWTVALLDTGLLPSLDAAAVAEGRSWGRAPYLSPEQAAGKSASVGSDVYVLGSLLYEMLAGRPPFRSKDESVLAFQHMRQQPPSLQILAPDAPEVLVQIVHQALARDSSARYRTAGQVGHILRTQVRRPQPAPRHQQVAAQQPPTRERLMVPPPPEPASVHPWSASEIYDPDRNNAWGNEPVGVDWLMIALLIAATVAVLGLVPLWRTVYKRYAAPELASAPASRYTLDEGITWGSATTEDWAGQHGTADRWTEVLGSPKRIYPCAVRRNVQLAAYDRHQDANWF